MLLIADSSDDGQGAHGRGRQGVGAQPQQQRGQHGGGDGHSAELRCRRSGCRGCSAELRSESGAVPSIRSTISPQHADEGCGGCPDFVRHSFCSATHVPPMLATRDLLALL